ncbi:unnamed protein product [Lactuca virosa]|uniref:QWRF motif-containing protein 7 n=1 Tax=Lactuca virosa TaxID=75947 RepID=A0AAU9MIF5_9ASTR|nr:unnamed protein product [Lactuca virosa]
MDQRPRSSSRLHHPSPAGKQPLPRLIRSKSENPAISPPPTTTLSNRSNTVSKSRSTSTSKTRNYKEMEVNSFMINLPKPMKINTGVTNPAVKKKKSSDADSNGGDGTFTRFLPRKKPTSPSAWALSPGRAPPILTAVVPPKTPSTGGRSSGEGGGGGGGRISGVLKYFKQKKVASSEEADRHCSKLMNNRLLQWRFANARAQAAMSTVKSVAEKKTFNAWLKILAIRNSNMVKRMEVEKLERDIRLYHIMNSQLFLLEKWPKLEAKNSEAVGRVARKLSVASFNIPLVDDSKGEILMVRDALDNATRLLEDIESTIPKLNCQVENSCYLLTELSIIAKEEKESLAELQRWMRVVMTLKIQEKERSLRAHLIQVK